MLSEAVKGEHQTEQNKLSQTRRETHPLPVVTPCGVTDAQVSALHLLPPGASLRLLGGLVTT